MLPQVFRETAASMAANATPHSINKWKHAGLNRANRRSFRHMLQRGQLRGHHIPTWLVAKAVRGAA